VRPLLQTHYVSFHQIAGRNTRLTIAGCYPFQDKDQFVIEETPHVYIVGNQPRFESTVVEGSDGQKCRIISVPRFKDTNELLLLDMETLEVEVVKFGVFQT
jgi:DNA polymerase delta subunit 2